jgi:hypothetical protein
MNFRTISLGVPAVAVGLALLGGANLPTHSRAEEVVAVTLPTDPVRQLRAETLRSIHELLLPTNRNYDHHRSSALKAIRAAAKCYGLELAGKGTGNLPQTDSDALVALSWQKLVEFRSQLPPDAADPAIGHVDQAIRELTLALELVLHYETQPTIAIPEEDAATLQTAYLILAPANGNYKGQRRAAMDQIEKAGRLVGLQFHVDGSGVEEQSTSDARLVLAQEYLETVRSHLTAPEQAPVRQFIETALSRLDLGLKHRAAKEGK